MRSNYAPSGPRLDRRLASPVVQGFGRLVCQGPQLNLIPSPTVLLGSLDGCAVSGSDLILLCTASTRLVSDNVQNLRRVRVRLMPRSPTMTKPPRVLAHTHSLLLLYSVFM